MKEISYGTVLPIPVDEAFEFVSEPANWPLFFESVRSAERQEGWARSAAGLRS